MGKLNGKTVVVTGGGGIGSAARRRFAAEGAKVAVWDMNLDAAEGVAAGIRDAGGQAQAFRCDITSRAEVGAAVAATEARLGPIGVLVNNAGWDVCPGPTDTALLQGVAEGAASPEKLLEAFAKAIPLGGLGRPDDLVGAIAFLGSDDAAFITGQVLSVSGGLTMAG